MQSGYSKSIEEVLKLLGTQEGGLAAEEAKIRLEKFGPNKLPEGKVPGFIVIFLRQFQSPLIYILLGAAVVVFLMGEPIDSLIIFFVLFSNAIVGTVQEGKAQNTLLALKNFSSSQATVLRKEAGIEKEIIIPDYEVVQGDILLLQEGEKVPADARIISGNSFKVNEASLTGESEPVAKSIEAIEAENLAPAEQRNMVFKGTNILSGNAKAAVTAIGLESEIGRIAKQIGEIETEIPLKKNIKYLSRLIMGVAGAISAFIIIFGLARGMPIQEVFTIAVAMTVSVIPEGLPIVITLVLATGVWRMSKRNALVKKLQAVESLGQTRIIAVDKTGTLTKNEMVLQKVWTGGKTFNVTGEGYEPKGQVLLQNEVVFASQFPELQIAGKVAAYCANAALKYVELEDRWTVAGDPTEAALLVFGEKSGYSHEKIKVEEPILSEIPFDYQKKFHATVHKNGMQNFFTIVGAPEKIISLCAEKSSELEEVFFGLAQEGFRVLAFAYNGNSPAIVKESQLPPLTFGGFYAIKDALRIEVKDVVKEVKNVGIRMVMITGDHKITAEAIAREAGIWEEGDKVLTGEELEKMTEFELSEELGAVSVFARVTPEHKLRIIEAYRKRGEVVAMTGDGVNDAPSLVAADLGVAMGKIGTEVAKEAADIILLDDNFGSIVAAAEEGRSIYKTIKKVILYLFSTSAGEVLVIVGSMLLLLPLPILPSQIIWLNFITDGFLVVALAMEPKEKGLLHMKFDRPKKWIIDSLMKERIFLMASVMTLGTLGLFYHTLQTDMGKAWSVSLTVLAVFQWFNAWNCRSDQKSIFSLNPFSNMYLVYATTIVVILQILALYTPFMQKVLHTVPLTLNEWLVIIPVASTILIAEEVRKFINQPRHL